MTGVVGLVHVPDARSGDGDQVGRGRHLALDDHPRSTAATTIEFQRSEATTQIEVGAT
jgi:hypothetical protein